MVLYPGISETVMKSGILVNVCYICYPNPHWARVVGYGSFSLCVINMESLCPSSEEINRPMMMKQSEEGSTKSLNALKGSWELKKC
jgi:hypothetical protein